MNEIEEAICYMQQSLMELEKRIRALETIVSWSEHVKQEVDDEKPEDPYP